MTASLRTVLARLLVAAFAIGSGGARAALQDEPSSANAASLPQPPSAERIKVAEGEHAAARGVGLGPIEEEVLNFRETWTLWRTSAGFDLEGERYYESPRGVGRINHFWLRLSPAMRLVASRDYTRLRWVWASGPLECDLTAGARCHAHPQHPADDLTFELGHPTGFISPLSVFSLSGITRGASQHRRTMTVSLADLRQPSPGSPVILVTHESRLSYLGKASISVAGRNWKAS